MKGIELFWAGLGMLLMVCAYIIFTVFLIAFMALAAWSYYALFKLIFL